MMSLPAPPILPIFTRSGDDFFVGYPDYDLKFQFLNVIDKGGLHAELTVWSDNPAFQGQMLWENITMNSGSSRSSAVKRLEQKWPGGPKFEYLLHQACEGVARRFREGEPFVMLTGKKRRSDRYRLTPLLVDGQINLLWGDGGAGKGFLALGAAYSVAKGYPHLGMPGIQGTVVYLDWETDDDEIDDRNARLSEGFMVAPIEILYRKCFSPIADDLQRILRFIGNADPGLVIVDSMGLAVGGNPNDSEDTIRAMRALRELRCTVLALDHIGKSDGNGGNAGGKSIGNSYKYHYARSVWELKKGESGRDNVIAAGLFHHKANNGKLWAPQGFEVQFQGDSGPVEIVHSIKASSIDGVKERLTVGRRILDALSESTQTAADLTADLEVKPDTIQKTLKRLSTRGLIVEVGGRWERRTSDRTSDRTT